ncbi:MAG: ABC transporter permease [Angelakisella sp.]
MATTTTVPTLSSVEVENRNKAREKRQLFLISAIGLAFFFGTWELVTRLEIIPSRYLNPPTMVIQTFFRKMVETNPDGATIPVHFWTSFKLALTGFLAAVVVGVPLGLIMGYYKTADRLIRPIFEVMRPIPPIAWIPISILWLGIGYPAKAFIIFMAAFVPCVINAHLGVTLTNRTLINVAKTCGASRWQIFTTICVPSAMPLVFTSLRIALGNAWSALVAAEMLAATAGLGFMIQQGRSFVRSDIIIVGMLVIGITGALMSACLAKLESKVSPWRVER